MSGHDTRLDRLEETLFFQERLLENLNSALTEQQRQLDAAQKDLAALRDKVLELSQMAGEGGGTANVPPPHYL